MRINKFLASCGLGSRRKVEEYISKGDISINGIVSCNLAVDVAENDIVCFKGKKITMNSDKVYIMLNKPKCYITSLKDDQNRKVVVDLLKGCKYKVFL